MKGMQGSIRRQPSSRLSFAGLRRHPRADLSVEVLVQDDDGWEVPLESFDFSPAGMFVRSNFLFEVGSTHNLIFRSPDGEELFGVRGQVVRVEKEVPAGGEGDAQGFVPGMAYEFLNMATEKQQRLRGLAARI